MANSTHVCGSATCAQGLCVLFACLFVNLEHAQSAVRGSKHPACGGVLAGSCAADLQWPTDTQPTAAAPRQHDWRHVLLLKVSIAILQEGSLRHTQLWFA